MQAQLSVLGSCALRFVQSNPNLHITFKEFNVKMEMYPEFDVENFINLENYHIY